MAAHVLMEPGQSFQYAAVWGCPNDFVLHNLCHLDTQGMHHFKPRGTHSLLICIFVKALYEWFGKATARGAAIVDTVIFEKAKDLKGLAAFLTDNPQFSAADEMAVQRISGKNVGVLCESQAPAKHQILLHSCIGSRVDSAFCRLP